MKFPKGEGSAVVHRKKNDLLHKDATYIYVCVTYSLWKGEFICNQNQVINRLKIPQGLSTLDLLSSVEWSSLKGRSPWWFTVFKRKRKKTCFTKMPYTYIYIYIYICLCHSFRKGEFTPNQSQVVNRLKIPQGLSTLDLLSSVEWSSLKGKGPQWFTVRKTTCFTKMPHTCVCLCHSFWKGEFTHNWKQVVNRLKIPQGLSTLDPLSSVEWSSLKGRGPWWFTVRKTTCFTKTPHTYMSVSPTASGRVNSFVIRTRS